MSPKAARKGFPFKRVLSGIAAAIIIGIVVWVGLPLLIPVWLVLAAIAIHEYSEMLELKGIPVRKRSLWVAAVLTMIAALPGSWFELAGLPAVIGTVSWRELLAVLFAVYLVILELIKPNRNSLNCVVFSLFGYLYIPFLLSYIISLRYMPDHGAGMWYLAFPMLAVVASDVGAYTIGSLFGRRKLALLISPGKTVEGAVGGLVFAVAFVAGLHWLATDVSGFTVELGSLWVFAIVVAAAGQAGDLFESLLKRWAGVKDSGTFLPGQGGVLDRIDSLIFAIAFCYMFLSLFVFQVA